MQITEHFSLAEVMRSSYADRHDLDNTPPQDIIDGAIRPLLENVAEKVRDRFGPFRPTSVYRSPEVNKGIGGSERSQHCKGEAMDFEVQGVDNLELAKWVRDNLEFDQLISEYYEAGKPSSGWVHVSFKASGENRMQSLTKRRGQPYVAGLPD